MTRTGELREVQFFERAGRIPLQPAPPVGRPFAEEGSAAIDGNRSRLRTRRLARDQHRAWPDRDPHSRSLWRLRAQTWRSMHCAGGDGARAALQPVFCDSGAGRRRRHERRHEAEKQALLPGIAAGETTATFAWVEDNGRWDAEGTALTATTER